MDDTFSPPWEQQVGDALPSHTPQIRERSVHRKLESVVTPASAHEPNSLAARLRKYNEGHRAAPAKTEPRASQLGRSASPDPMVRRRVANGADAPPSVAVASVARATSETRDSEVNLRSSTEPQSTRIPLYRMDRARLARVARPIGVFRIDRARIDQEHAQMLANKRLERRRVVAPELYDGTTLPIGLLEEYAASTDVGVNMLFANAASVDADREAVFNAFGVAEANATNNYVRTRFVPKAFVEAVLRTKGFQPDVVQSIASLASQDGDGGTPVVGVQSGMTYVAFVEQLTELATNAAAELRAGPTGSASALDAERAVVADQNFRTYAETMAVDSAVNAANGGYVPGPPPTPLESTLVDTCTDDALERLANRMWTTYSNPSPNSPQSTLTSTAQAAFEAVMTILHATAEAAYRGVVRYVTDRVAIASTYVPRILQNDAAAGNLWLAYHAVRNALLQGDTSQAQANYHGREAPPTDSPSRSTAGAYDRVLVWFDALITDTPSAHVFATELASIRNALTDDFDAVVHRFQAIRLDLVKYEADLCSLLMSRAQAITLSAPTSITAVSHAAASAAEVNSAVSMALAVPIGPSGVEPRVPIAYPTGTQLSIPAATAMLGEASMAAAPVDAPAGATSRKKKGGDEQARERPRKKPSAYPKLVNAKRKLDEARERFHETLSTSVTKLSGELMPRGSFDGSAAPSDTELAAAAAVWTSLSKFREDRPLNQELDRKRTRSYKTRLEMVGAIDAACTAAIKDISTLIAATTTPKTGCQEEIGREDTNDDMRAQIAELLIGVEQSTQNATTLTADTAGMVQAMRSAGTPANGGGTSSTLTSVSGAIDALDGTVNAIQPSARAAPNKNVRERFVAGLTSDAFKDKRLANAYKTNLNSLAETTAHFALLINRANGADRDRPPGSSGPWPGLTSCDAIVAHAQRYQDHIAKHLDALSAAFQKASVSMVTSQANVVFNQCTDALLVNVLFNACEVVALGASIRQTTGSSTYVDSEGKSYDLEPLADVGDLDNALKQLGAPFDQLLADLPVDKRREAVRKCIPQNAVADDEVAKAEKNFDSMTEAVNKRRHRPEYRNVLRLLADSTESSVVSASFYDWPTHYEHKIYDVGYEAAFEDKDSVLFWSDFGKEALEKLLSLRTKSEVKLNGQIEMPATDSPSELMQRMLTPLSATGELFGSSIFGAVTPSTANDVQLALDAVEKDTDAVWRTDDPTNYESEVATAHEFAEWMVKRMLQHMTEVVRKIRSGTEPEVGSDHKKQLAETMNTFKLAGDIFSECNLPATYWYRWVSETLAKCDSLLANDQPRQEYTKLLETLEKWLQRGQRRPKRLMGAHPATPTISQVKSYVEDVKSQLTIIAARLAVDTTDPLHGSDALHASEAQQAARVVDAATSQATDDDERSTRSGAPPSLPEYGNAFEQMADALRRRDDARTRSNVAARYIDVMRRGLAKIFADEEKKGTVRDVVSHPFYLGFGAAPGELFADALTRLQGPINPSNARMTNPALAMRVVRWFADVFRRIKDVTAMDADATPSALSSLAVTSLDDMQVDGEEDARSRASSTPDASWASVSDAVFRVQALKRVSNHTRRAQLKDVSTWVNAALTAYRQRLNTNVFTGLLKTTGGLDCADDETQQMLVSFNGLGFLLLRIVQQQYALAIYDVYRLSADGADFERLIDNVKVVTDNELLMNTRLKQRDVSENITSMMRSPASVRVGTVRDTNSLPALGEGVPALALQIPEPFLGSNRSGKAFLDYAYSIVGLATDGDVVVPADKTALATVYGGMSYASALTTLCSLSGLKVEAATSFFSIEAVRDTVNESLEWASWAHSLVSYVAKLTTSLLNETDRYINLQTRFPSDSGVDHASLDDLYDSIATLRAFMKEQYDASARAAKHHLTEDDVAQKCNGLEEMLEEVIGFDQVEEMRKMPFNNASLERTGFAAWTSSVVPVPADQLATFAVGDGTAAGVAATVEGTASFPVGAPPIEQTEGDAEEARVIFASIMETLGVVGHDSRLRSYGQALALDDKAFDVGVGADGLPSDANLTEAIRTTGPFDYVELSPDDVATARRLYRREIFRRRLLNMLAHAPDHCALHSWATKYKLECEGLAKRVALQVSTHCHAAHAISSCLLATLDLVARLAGSPAQDALAGESSLLEARALEIDKLFDGRVSSAVSLSIAQEAVRLRLGNLEDARRGALVAFHVQGRSGVRPMSDDDGVDASDDGDDASDDPAALYKTALLILSTPNLSALLSSAHGGEPQHNDAQYVAPNVASLLAGHAIDTEYNPLERYGVPNSLMKDDFPIWSVFDDFAQADSDDDVIRVMSAVESAYPGTIDALRHTHSAVNSLMPSAGQADADHMLTAGKALREYAVSASYGALKAAHQNLALERIKGRPLYQPLSDVANILAPIFVYLEDMHDRNNEVAEELAAIASAADAAAAANAQSTLLQAIAGVAQDGSTPANGVVTAPVLPDEDMYSEGDDSYSDDEGSESDDARMKDEGATVVGAHAAASGVHRRHRELLEAAATGMQKTTAIFARLDAERDRVGPKESKRRRRVIMDSDDDASEVSSDEEGPEQTPVPEPHQEREYRNVPIGKDTEAVLDGLMASSVDTNSPLAGLAIYFNSVETLPTDKSETFNFLSRVCRPLFSPHLPGHLHASSVDEAIQTLMVYLCLRAESYHAAALEEEAAAASETSSPDSHGAGDGDDDEEYGDAFLRSTLAHTALLRKCYSVNDGQEMDQAIRDEISKVFERHVSMARYKRSFFDPDDRGEIPADRHGMLPYDVLSGGIIDRKLNVETGAVAFAVPDPDRGRIVVLKLRPTLHFPFSEGYLNNFDNMHAMVGMHVNVSFVKPPEDFQTGVSQLSDETRRYFASSSHEAFANRAATAAAVAIEDDHVRVEAGSASAAGPSNASMAQHEVEPLDRRVVVKGPFMQIGQLCVAALMDANGSNRTIQDVVHATLLTNVTLTAQHGAVVLHKFLFSNKPEFRNASDPSLTDFLRTDRPKPGPPGFIYRNGADVVDVLVEATPGAPVGASGPVERAVVDTSQMLAKLRVANGLAPPPLHARANDSDVGVTQVITQTEQGGPIKPLVRPQGTYLDREHLGAQMLSYGTTFDAVNVGVLLEALRDMPWGTSDNEMRDNYMKTLFYTTTLNRYTHIYAFVATARQQRAAFLRVRARVLRNSTPNEVKQSIARVAALDAQAQAKRLKASSKTLRRGRK